MATIVGNISFHHEDGRTPYRFVYDLPDGADVDTHMVLMALADQFGIDADRDSLAIHAAIEKAKTTNGVASFTVYDRDGLDEGEDDADLLEEHSSQFVVWHHPPERPGEQPNFGISEGDSLSKNENVWLFSKPYEPDPKMRERLEKFDKEQLLAILLRTHAESRLSFPPEDVRFGGQGTLRNADGSRNIFDDVDQ